MYDLVLKVTIIGMCSGAKSTNARTHHGSIQGSLFFITFTDSMLDKLHKPAILYADDSTVVSTVKYIGNFGQLWVAHTMKVCCRYIRGQTAGM